MVVQLSLTDLLGKVNYTKAIKVIILRLSFSSPASKENNTTHRYTIHESSLSIIFQELQSSKRHEILGDKFIHLICTLKNKIILLDTGSYGHDG